MAKDWLIAYCDDCRCEMPYLAEWSFVPDRCRSCREARKAQWYERSCSDCGTMLRIHRDWSNPPTMCPSCRERRKAQWTEKRCDCCGQTMRVHREWNPVPDWCKDCRSSYPSRTASCNHCGSGFEIKSGTRIKCKINGWDEPKRCLACRELFQWKPFKTVKEYGLLGGVVFRTYNSRGALIRESREEATIFNGPRTRHTDKRGNTHGFSYEREGLLGPYTEITDKRGKVVKRKPRT